MPPSGAIITFLPQDKHVSPAIRTVVLSPASSCMKIGRTSVDTSKGLLAKWDNLLFPSPVISRQHAKLVLNTKTWLIEVVDEGSLHGTYLEGKRLPCFEPVVLPSGSTIVFGREVMDVKIGTSHVHPPQKFQVVISLRHADPLSKTLPSTSDSLAKTTIHIQPDKTGEAVIDLTGADTPVGNPGNASRSFSYGFSSSLSDSESDNSQDDDMLDNRESPATSSVLRTGKDSDKDVDDEMREEYLSISDHSSDSSKEVVPELRQGSQSWPRITGTTIMGDDQQVVPSPVGSDDDCSLADMEGFQASSPEAEHTVVPSPDQIGKSTTPTTDIDGPLPDTVTTSTFEQQLEQAENHTRLTLSALTTDKASKTSAYTDSLLDKDSTNTATILEEKSGKASYSAAHEQNKALFGDCQSLPPEQVACEEPASETLLQISPNAVNLVTIDQHPGNTVQKNGTVLVNGNDASVSPNTSKNSSNASSLSKKRKCQDATAPPPSSSGFADDAFDVPRPTKRPCVSRRSTLLRSAFKAGVTAAAGGLGAFVLLASTAPTFD